MSDKILREKMRHLQAPLDPAAWGAMEAMLDGNKKRRVLGWWLYAVLLLITLGSATVWQWTKMEKQKYALKVPKSTKNAASKTTGVWQKNTMNNSTSAQQTNHNLITASKQEAAQNKPIISPNKSASTSKKIYKLKAENQLANNRLLYHFEGKKNMKRSNANRVSNAPAPTEQLNNNTSNVLGTENIAATEARTAAQYFNPLALLTAEELRTFTEATTPEKVVNNNNQPTSKAKKKKVRLSYALGLRGDVSAALSKRVWASKPTWATGFTHELQIGKWLGITNTIAYEETSFQIEQPNNVTYINPYPLSYISQIKQLDFLLGVRGYFYNDTKVRLFAEVAYGHHFKLVEKFKYDLHNNPANNNLPIDPVLYYVEKNDFLNNDKSLAPFLTNNAISASSNSQYALAGNNNNYSTTQLSIGADVQVHQHWLLGIAPTFSMPLQKIGTQEQRKYNFGVGGMVRYKF